MDTGCTSTIIAERIFQQIPENRRPAVEPHRSTVVSADGSPISLTGTATMTICVGGKTRKHRVIIADVSNEGLIGIDFMKAHGVVVLNFDGETVTWGDEPVAAQCRLGKEKACRIQVAENVVIPAGSRTIIKGRASKPLVPGDWLIEPLQTFKTERPVLTARTLIRGDGMHVPMELMNPTDEDVLLYKSTHVGIISPILEPEVANLAAEVPRENTRKEAWRTLLPPELETMMAEIQVPLTSQQEAEVRHLLLRNREVFATKGKPLGRTDLVKHEIVTGDQAPIKQAVRRPPFHLRQEANDEVQKMLREGVIEPSCSPWASPVVLVRKKDGGLRYCLDYRKLNAVTRKDSYPLPRIDESLDSLGQAQYFSALDLASGYWQIGLSDDAKEKSAFCTPSGLFQFRVMPFGLTNAPATFQRLMERVLTSLNWQICIVYIDDVIVFSQTLTEHLAHLQEIFSRLKSAGLKLKPKKCSLLCQTVKYLGHIVGKDGVATDPEKIESVRNWPRLRTVTDVRSFIGLCSYYRRFIPGFAAVAKPLIRLTEKDSPFTWGDAQEESWEKLKHLLTTAPILAYPDRNATFILDTDASDVGIGAVLSQTIDGEERVIAYGSRVLTKQERRYCVTRRELLAVVHFVKVYRHYLAGKPFLLRTDHSALRWLRSFKEPEGQLARWLETLDTYAFELRHRPGVKHGNADAMSRGPCAQCQGDHAGEVIRSGRRPKKPPEDDKKSSGVQDRSTRRKPTMTKTEGQEEVPPSPVENEDARRVQTRRQAKQTENKTEWLGSNWLHSQGLDLTRVRDAQASDPALSAVRCWMQQGKRPEFADISQEGEDVKFYWSQFQSIKVEEGVLIRGLKCAGMPERKQVLTPGCLREEALSLSHEVITAGHLGIRKTLANCRRRFLWPRMVRDVEMHVRTCSVCGQYKTVGKRRRAPMKTHVVGLPMERVCIDIVGPFPESTRGNKYALVVTDWFTKYVEIYPMPNQEAVMVAEIMTKQFFSRYGVPLFLHSDQGTQFESKLFQEMCVMMGVKKTRTTPFHPQSDGISERNIKTLTKMIAMTTDDQCEWDANLNFLSMAYRATPHDSTGVSPNYMMYGRDVNMPVDVMVGLPSDHPKSTLEYVQKLRRQLEEAYETARRGLRRSADRQKRLYDTKIHGNGFQPGNLCWCASKVRKKGVSPKFQPAWYGPCLVVKVHSDVVMEIQSKATKTRIVHVDLLKPCFSDKMPRWMQKERRRILQEGTPTEE